MNGAKKLTTENLNYLSGSDKSTSERVRETHTSELVFGICSQIGAKKQIIVDEIKNTLKEYDYTFMEIRLSQFIEEDTNTDFQFEGFANKTDGYNNYVSKIKKGNHLREKYGNDYLANLSISKIANSKKAKFHIESEGDFSNISSQRICYIIDSIKHKDELSALKDIYGDVFYLISIFTPREERIKNISIPDITVSEAKDIINIDEYQESDKKNGQQVREVYVNADFFIKVDDKNIADTKSKISRFINLIFEDTLVTPTNEERAMFEAKSASVNSACLSRQVGASIISENGELLSVGWNDVPKYGGNLYDSSSVPDNRCYNKGLCFNDLNKENIRQVIRKQFDNEIDVLNVKKKDEILKALDRVLHDSSIKLLIEFSRSVHAEMHAILNAGLLNIGSKLRNSTLFCTTYPCHNCVRHIIASGITKLYYIEPYTKSKGIDLHSDSITDDTIIENQEEKEKKVQILMFEGISPKKYLSFFNKDRSRKDKVSGKSVCNKRVKKDLEPINSLSLQALFYRELQASKRITQKQELLSKNEN